ncbi:DNA-binding transcriptional regulator, MarR family [Micrococcales bacterium KH10]|nr:DNA-binding transcriptional regulator, MarR family [Micrococcales bacterium KH10]
MGETRWLSAQELGAWVKLEAIAELLPGALDQPLQRAHGLNHYDYITLAQLSEAPERTLKMTELAARTSATLPRLSHVVTRLEQRGYVRRAPSPLDRRVTLATLTEEGWQAVVAAAPTHVESVRELVIDRLTSDQLEALEGITDALLGALDPDDRIGLRQMCAKKVSGVET